MPIFNKRFPLRNQAGEGGEGGGGQQGGQQSGQKPAPESFSREYVQELRHESASYRTKAQEAERKAQEAAEALAKAAKDAEDKITAANKAANDRIIRAELKAAALKAGMVDLDGLKLADLSKVKLNDQGEVEGADALMEEMKKAKPYLFGTANTSNTQQTPAKGKTETKKVTEMTPAEYAAAKNAAIKGARK